VFSFDYEAVAGFAIVAGAAVLFVRRLRKELKDPKSPCAACNLQCEVRDTFAARGMKKSGRDGKPVCDRY
jgi:hypothetical protein